MKTKKFDNLGIEPSLLGFGCMRFPLDEDGKINEKEAEKMIDKAIGSGVTYIDTAFPYHNGDSEPFVGNLVSMMNIRFLKKFLNIMIGIFVNYN